MPGNSTRPGALDRLWQRAHTISPARSDLETLLLPLLRMLYSAAGRAPSHLYMLLIILLILTQDASFAANVHKVPRTCLPVIEALTGFPRGKNRLVLPRYRRIGLFEHALCFTLHEKEQLPISLW